MSRRLQKLETICRELGSIVAEAVAHEQKPPIGYMLVLFERASTGHLTFVANVDRDELDAVLARLATGRQGGKQRPATGKKGKAS